MIYMGFKENVRESLSIGLASLAFAGCVNDNKNKVSSPPVAFELSDNIFAQKTILERNYGEVVREGYCHLDGDGGKDHYIVLERDNVQTYYGLLSSQIVCRENPRNVKRLYGRWENVDPNSIPKLP